VLGIRGGVDRSSFWRRNEYVAVGAGRIRARFEVPARECCAGPGGKVGSVLCAVRNIYRRRRTFGNSGQELDDAAERITTIEVRFASAENLHTRKLGAGYPIPVNPAAEWIYHWDSLFENKRAAGPASAQAAKRSPERSGIGDPAT